MADPRLYTLTHKSVAGAAKIRAGIGMATSAKRNFLSAANKVGDLVTIASTGGSIGEGLKALVGISGSIRAGNSAIPSSIQGDVSAGVGWVLAQVGIATTAVDAVRALNPTVADQATTQAAAVFQQIQAGEFRAADISNALQHFQNLENLSLKIFTPGNSGDNQSSTRSLWEPSPYAVDLIAHAPKFKFMFVVQFITNTAYHGLEFGGTPVLDMAFAVKRSSRPNIKFQTEELNYYNYRTSTITKTSFEEMTMSFHDDNRNAATQFYTSYLKAVSPIANLNPAQGFTGSDALEQRGMDFIGQTNNIDQPNLLIDDITVHTYAGSSGTLAQDEKTVFAGIRLYHVFDYGKRMTVYNFVNPRITSLAPDDLDMSVGNEGNELSITFTYDSVYVDPDVDLAAPGRYGNLRDRQPGALYPLQYQGSASAAGGSSSSGFNPFNTPSMGSASTDMLNWINTR